MLKMKPTCERCTATLPAARTGAFICSFECTFCEACAGGELAGTCPNCAGALLPRPTRAAARLDRFPPESVMASEATGRDLAMGAISLVQLSPEGLAALARGDLQAARRCFPFLLSDYFVGPECLGTWRLREAQIAREPEAAGWLTRFIVDTSLVAAIGRAGFHGPPDAEGRVEVGYSVDPAFRRRGYARAALLVLLDWARSDPSIQTVRASIAPGNLASRRLVDAHGFIECGEQWDDEDGLEMIFEVNLVGF